MEVKSSTFIYFDIWQGTLFSPHTIHISSLKHSFNYLFKGVFIIHLMRRFVFIYQILNWCFIYSNLYVLFIIVSCCSPCSHINYAILCCEFCSIYNTSRSTVIVCLIWGGIFTRGCQHDITCFCRYNVWITICTC